MAKRVAELEELLQLERQAGGSTESEQKAKARRISKATLHKQQEETASRNAQRAEELAAKNVPILQAKQEAADEHVFAHVG